MDAGQRLNGFIKEKQEAAVLCLTVNMLMRRHLLFLLPVRDLLQYFPP